MIIISKFLISKLDFINFIYICIELQYNRVVFFAGNLCMITGGRNLGRVGTVVSRERHPGSFDIVHIKDAVGHIFATR